MNCILFLMNYILFLMNYILFLMNYILFFMNYILFLMNYFFFFMNYFLFLHNHFFLLISHFLFMMFSLLFSFNFILLLILALSFMTFGSFSISILFRNIRNRLFSGRDFLQVLLYINSRIITRQRTSRLSFIPSKLCFLIKIYISQSSKVLSRELHNVFWLKSQNFSSKVSQYQRKVFRNRMLLIVLTCHYRKLLYN